MNLFKAQDLEGWEKGGILGAMKEFSEFESQLISNDERIAEYLAAHKPKSLLLKRYRYWRYKAIVYSLFPLFCSIPAPFLFVMLTANLLRNLLSHLNVGVYVIFAIAFFIPIIIAVLVVKTIAFKKPDKYCEIYGRALYLQGRFDTVKSHIASLKLSLMKKRLKNLLKSKTEN